MSRSYGFASGVLLACLAAALMLGLASLGIANNRKDEGLAAVWLANAVIIALLLRHRREQWPALLWGALAGNFAAGLLAGDGPALSLALGFCSLTEILLVTSLFAPQFGPRALVPAVAARRARRPARLSRAGCGPRPPRRFGLRRAARCDALGRPRALRRRPRGASA